MPVTLVIEAARKRTPRAEPDAAALLHREADRLYPQLRTLWRTIFQDVRQHVPLGRLREALRLGDLVEAENLVRTSWMRYGDQAARALLPTVLSETVSRVAEALTVTAEVGVQFNVQVPEVVQAINTYAGQQIVGIGNTTMEAVRGVLRQGATEGLPLYRQVEALADIVGLTPSQARTIDRLRSRLQEEGRTPAQIERAVDLATRRALRLRGESIARTESMAAANMGSYLRLQQQLQAGLIDRDRTRRHWLVAADDRLCPECRQIPGMNPEGVEIDQPFQTPYGSLLYPPAHPMCVSGDTLVTPGGRIAAYSKRWYEGEVLWFTTALGYQLRATPNHPILTPHGWVAASLLQKGDDILSGRLTQHIGGSNPDIQHMPSQIHEMFDAWKHQGIMQRLPITQADFHGDVRQESYVDIISGHSVLRDGSDALLRQHIDQSLLIRADEPGLSLALQRPAMQDLHAIALAAPRCLCGRRKATAVIRGSLRHQPSVGFSMPSHRDAGLLQSAGDDRATDLEGVRQSLHRRSGEILADYIVERQCLNFSGYVYNLQTEDAYYLAGGSNVGHCASGIITHNCRCTVSLVIAP